MTVALENLNIQSQRVLISPDELKKAVPIPESTKEAVAASRRVIRDILDRKDHRIFLLVGPCSIHDTKAALEYAQRLRCLADEVSDTFYMVMRVYFEKPRTTVGWKGLINDPLLDDSFRIEDGLHIGRRLLLDIAAIGLPISTEALDPISPQYLQDVVTWSAIGARTTESQTHREMASGLSSAVGFKNGTDGGLVVAINALKSAKSPHRFLGINSLGQVAVIHTSGNQYAHIVLRGGSTGPNFNSANIKICEKELEKANVPANIVVDCSHANSNKDPCQQTLVMENVASQIVDGNRSIVGLMVESNLCWGNQLIPEDLCDLKYGVSVTDACIDWNTTKKAVYDMYIRLRDVLPKR